jgi:hypothetical protein
MLYGALAGVAAWTSNGQLAIDTRSDSPQVIGLLPSLASLAVIVVAGSLAARWVALQSVPAALFLLPLASVLAWTTWPSSLPAVVAWAGPSASLLFTLLAVGIVLRLLAGRREVGWQRFLTPFVDHRWSPAIAAAGCALWLAALLISATSLPVTGDEPHYLLVAQSILSDGDIDLRNNYDEGTYRAFYAGFLQRHANLGVLGQEFSFHGLALSVLLIPGYALGGVLGARVLIIFVTAAGAGFFWAAARRLTSSPAAAWASWLAMVSSAPFALHGIMLYPDGVAAALTSIAVWALVSTVSGSPHGRLRQGLDAHVVALIGSGIALSTLPWFHIRLSLTAAVLGFVTVWALWQRRRRDLIFPFLAAPIVSFVLWIASAWVMFRTLDPTAAFRERAAGNVAQVPVGTLGLLFDIEYGLFTYAPALIFSVLGVATLWRRTRLVTFAAVVLTLATLLLASAWIWWGGDSAPARFLVPIVPLTCLSLAAWWTSASIRARTFASVTTVIGAWLTACLALAGGGSYSINAPDGRATIFEWLGPNVDLSLALPSLFRPDAQAGAEGVVAALWIATGLVALAVIVHWRRRVADSIGASWLLASTVTIVWLTSGASLALLWRDVPPWTPDRGQLRLLQTAGSSTLELGIHGPAPRFVSRDEALSSLGISMPTTETTPVLLHVPFVPAGRYQIGVDLSAATTDASSSPTLRLELGREAAPFAIWAASDSASAPSFSLAVPIWSIRVLASEPTRRLAGAVRLTPVLVSAPSSPTPGIALRATRYGALVVYSLDPYTYVEREGFWLAADRQGSVVVADVDGRAVSHILHLEGGPAAVTLTVARGSFTRTVALAPGATERVAVPDDLGSVAPLRFVVSGNGAASGEGRRLGAFVRVLAQ